jgi:uncharacterized cupin superfamily protein
LFNITNFGVNITTLEPGGISALRHAHSKQDEFIYIIQGEATLITNEGELQLESGMCAGFKHGTGNAHQIVNKSPGTVIYLEVGDRTEGDEVIYPDNDIAAKLTDGKWQFTHKNGDPY